jgi:leader peptidase (prepilin peptidase)/N-methyltransferase
VQILVLLAANQETRNVKARGGTVRIVRTCLVGLLASLVLFTVTLRYGLALETLQFYVLMGLLALATMTDFESRTIPNKLVLAGITNRIAFIVVGTAVAAMAGDVSVAGETVRGVSTAADASIAGLIANILAELGRSLACGILAAMPLFAVALVFSGTTGSPAVGGGDIKLVFMAGLYFGVTENLVMLVLACALGTVFGLVSMVRARGGLVRGHTFPFGPSIAVATWTVALFGAHLVGW